MTLNEAEQLLDGFLTGLISSLGFGRTEVLIYGRQVHDATGRLAFPCRIDPRGPGCFTCNVGLRFESLAQWLHDDDSGIGPTIMRPVHLIREDNTFTEWKFSVSEELEQLQEPILRDLENIALPHIERYSRLAELRKVLESPNPKDWIRLGVNVDRRVTILAAIQFVEGDKAGAIKTLDDALLERKTAFPKRRFAIEYLRKRMLA